MSRADIKPAGQEEEVTYIIQCEGADKVRENLLQLAGILGPAAKTNFRHMVESDQTGMALMLAEVSARPDAPKTYREWRKWLLEEYRCDT